MSFENPANIIRSWNLQSSFANGPVQQDKLVPPQYGRIRTLFQPTWREQSLGTTLDWGSQNFSVYLPESLRVIGAIYLKVNLPAIGNGQVYKKYPALYGPLKTLRLLSAGQEVYTVDVQRYLVDYCQSLTDEQVSVFSRVYLGHQDSMDGTARTVMIPIMLPNSQYLGRAGHDARGHGC